MSKNTPPRAPSSHRNLPIQVPPWMKSSHGRAFVIGQTSIYVGPREATRDPRTSKKPPVLAYARPTDDEPHIVAEFPNANMAEQFMAAMTAGVEEATLAAANAQRPDLAPAAPGEPQCGDEHDVETPFGMIPSKCERPPHKTGDHAGPLVDDRLPPGFPRRANWTAS